MTAFVGLTCNCGAADCDDVILVDDAHSDTEARIAAYRKGWDCDTLPGGTTVDFAPGHTWVSAA